MVKLIGIILILTLTVVAFTGCRSAGDNGREDTAIFEKITADRAKEIIDQNKEAIILDVRTEEEFNEGHIEGAILIPVDEIKTHAEEFLTDKSASILVYCRSGRRSALAASELKALGYLNIYDFGGILDWPYEIITE